MLLRCVARVALVPAASLAKGTMGCLYLRNTAPQADTWRYTWPLSTRLYYASRACGVVVAGRGGAGWCGSGGGRGVAQRCALRV